MKKTVFHILMPVAAGIVIGCAGCDIGTHREEAARLRLEKRMAQVRVMAARELLAAGYVDQAQRVLEPYLPSLESEASDKVQVADEVQVALEPAKTAEKQQLVLAELEPSGKRLRIRYR